MRERSDHFDDLETLQKDVGFTQAVRIGDMVYLSGTAALLPDFTAAHPGDFEAQLDFVYRAIGKTLAQFGASHKDIVREIMYVTDMEKLRHAIPQRKLFYGNGDGPFPASTGVEVRALVLPDLMIEVEVTARIP
jgi:2-iminobutanoate/2-iminopropanoate deaminase